MVATRAPPPAEKRRGSSYLTRIGKDRGGEANGPRERTHQGGGVVVRAYEDMMVDSEIEK